MVFVVMDKKAVFSLSNSLFSVFSLSSLVVRSMLDFLIYSKTWRRKYIHILNKVEDFSKNVTLWTFSLRAPAVRCMSF